MNKKILRAKSALHAVIRKERDPDSGKLVIIAGCEAGSSRNSTVRHELVTCGNCLDAIEEKKEEDDPGE